MRAKIIVYQSKCGWCNMLSHCTVYYITLHNDKSKQKCVYSHFKHLLRFSTKHHYLKLEWLKSKPTCPIISFCDILHSLQTQILQSTFSQLTLLFLVDARGSVIHAPNRAPDVLIVTGPVIFINFPHAVNKEIQQ